MPTPTPSPSPSFPPEPTLPPVVPGEPVCVPSSLNFRDVGNPGDTGDRGTMFEISELGGPPCRIGGTPTVVARTSDGRKVTLPPYGPDAPFLSPHSGDFSLTTGHPVYVIIWTSADCGAPTATPSGAYPLQYTDFRFTFNGGSVDVDDSNVSTLCPASVTRFSQ